MMNQQEAIAKLDAIKFGDTEGAHSEADGILLACVPAAVAEAWKRADARSGGFWYA